MSYILPDMVTVINLSGGRTSAFMLIKILEYYNGILPDHIKVIFQNTGKEMPQTYDFLHELEERLKVNIIWLEYDLDKRNRPVAKITDYKNCSKLGEPFEKLIDKRKYLPNATQRFCTSELKILTGKRYMVKKGHKKWYSVIGLRYDECGRIKKKIKDNRITPVYPLFLNKISVSNIFDYWENSNFDLQLPNINGTTPLGNCDGCFLKSEKTKAFICKTLPDSAKWWAAQESKNSALFRNKNSWKDLIDFVGSQSEFDFDDKKDLYCDNSLGSCNDF